ncbi:unnamed protein product [Caenorhabditis auriculariae]|uniref:Uncharacterized protein n=1 Tax=Caenorhabditis auriculariae TaxID=2777116 RepID=A0A8S1GUZ1_9PELO|nr:unnamed protein product [Caenorhabditis auriculariae]
MAKGSDDETSKTSSEASSFDIFSSKHFRAGFAFSLTFVFLLFVMFHTHDEDLEKSRRILSNKELFEELEHKYGGSRVVGHICGKTECFHVRDVFGKDEKGVHFATRVIHQVGLPEGCISMIKLKQPVRPTMRSLNTRDWEIDKRVIDRMGYNGRLIEFIFTSGAVPMNLQAKADVLAIGTGGGAIMNYLSANFPNFNVTGVEIDPLMIDISRDYFGVRQSEKARVLEADGLKVLQDMAEAGDTVNALILDACNNDFRDEWTCPIVGFLQDSTLSNIKKVIGNKGVIAMNVLAGSGLETSTEVVQLREKLKIYFSSCTFTTLEHMDNVVVECNNIVEKKTAVQPLEAKEFVEKNGIEHILLHVNEKSYMIYNSTQEENEHEL